MSWGGGGPPQGSGKDCSELQVRQRRDPHKTLIPTKMETNQDAHGGHSRCRKRAHQGGDLCPRPKTRQLQQTQDQDTAPFAKTQRPNFRGKHKPPKKHSDGTEKERTTDLAITVTNAIDATLKAPKPNHQDPREKLGSHLAPSQTT